MLFSRWCCADPVSARDDMCDKLACSHLANNRRAHPSTQLWLVLHSVVPIVPIVPIVPEARPDARPEARPEARPDARPDARPEARPEALHVDTSLDLFAIQGVIQVKLVEAFDVEVAFEVAVAFEFAVAFEVAVAFVMAAWGIFVFALLFFY